MRGGTHAKADVALVRGTQFARRRSWAFHHIIIATFVAAALTGVLVVVSIFVVLYLDPSHSSLPHNLQRHIHFHVRFRSLIDL